MENTLTNNAVKKSNNCLVCGSGNNNRIFKCDSFELYRCFQCSNTYLLSDLKEEYEENYYVDRNAYYRNYKKDYDENKHPIPMYKDILTNIGALGYSKGKLLEIGCSKGFFLHLADKQGFSVYGLDISEYAINYIKDNFRFPVMCSDIVNARFPDNFFDLIVMIDVIEHASNPDEVLRESYKVLKPGGLIVIDTPNEDSLINLVSFAIYRLSWDRIKFFVRSNHDIEHQVYFSQTGIKNLLIAHSFKILKMKLFNIDPSLMGLNPMVNLCAKLVFFIAEILGMQNKMIIFARKTEAT